MKTIIEELAEEAFHDEYLKRLLYKLETNYAKRLVEHNCKINILEKDLYSLLRFADILCRSNKTEHRNLSLKIISLVIEFKDFKEMEYVKVISMSTLVKLGNFPSLEIVDNIQKYANIFEIKIEYILKEILQKSPLGGTFTDAQYKLFKELTEKNHYSFSGSTSFGKSYIFEAFTKHLIKEHNRSDNIVFLVPTKALIHQVTQRLKEIVQDESYRIISTPKIPKLYLKESKKYIFIFTAERLISYLLEGENPKIDYLFVDEAHKLLSFNDTRTPLLYHALMLAKRKSIHMYFAAPNIKNADVFLKLVNNSTEESMAVQESPVTQNRFYIDTIQNYAYMLSDYGSDIKLPQLNFEEDSMNNLKKILDIFSYSETDGEQKQSIVYCNTIDHTIQSAIKIAKKYKEVSDAEIDAIIDLIDEKVHQQYYLKECLKHGIAYHFGGIPEELKVRIEKLYKSGKIKIVFCTSSLLEGVNLPAKNIFILSENIGMSKMTSIDFWNLAGRAGRLKKDLSGNIFCVNIFNKDGYWKQEKNIKILRNKKIKDVEPRILSKRNGNLYENISNYYVDKPYTRKKMSKAEQQIIEMYGNILLYHDSLSSESVLKDKFVDSNERQDRLKKIQRSLKIPGSILARNVDIGFQYQDNIFIEETPTLPEGTTYMDCLKVLEILYEQYCWDKTENKGLKPMARSKKQLVYYAILMESWINMKPLKLSIESAIQHYHNNGNPKEIHLIPGQPGVPFNIEDSYMINHIINTTINDIENILRFKIKNYISNYQEILKAKNKECIRDWESCIEYGTTDQEIIEIQNLGFTRHIAIFLSNYFKNIFVKKDGVICDIEDEKLRGYLEKDKEKYFLEYEEIAEFLGWKGGEEK